MRLLLGILVAFVIHAGIILFAGLLFFNDEKNHGTLQEVELLDDTALEEKKNEPEPEPEEIKAETEEVPDASEIIEKLEMETAANNPPELEALSLGQLAQVLGGQGGGGDFGQSFGLEGGGVIGGKGKSGAGQEKVESAFSLIEMDQKPQPTFQAAPVYPSEMRGKKVEGLVTVIFIVDPAGKVTSPRVERSSHVAFEKPALDAVRRWKFEPGVKAGERVACKMRVPIRFQPS